MKDELQVCPFCGYVVGTPTEDEAFLEPGYLLSGRYLIGQVLEHDVVSVTYAAFDTASDMKVKAREYLPTVYASRYNNEPELSVDESSSKAFSDGFNKFVDEAKRLSRGEGGVTLYDCIAENGTAYMILESPDKKKAEAPAAEPHKEEKKDNKLLNIITTAPLWLKILVPAVVVILAVVLIAAGTFKSDEDITESAAEETESAETVLETEATEAPMTVNVPVLNIDDHSYACYFGCESWEQARDYCESVGGHLATISSQEENDALYAFALSCGYDNVYIGYSDIDSEGVWQWVNGEEPGYTNWSEGEPNGFTPSENYAVMVDGGYWNDGDYSPRIETGLVSYICEWDYTVYGTDNLDREELMSTFEMPQLESEVIVETVLNEESIVEPVEETAQAVVVEDTNSRLTEAQATQAFEAYISTIYENISVPEDVTCYWWDGEVTGDVMEFGFRAYTGVCIIYSMNLNSGDTYSVVYSSMSQSEMLEGSAYTFNAWDYL